MKIPYGAKNFDFALVLSALMINLTGLIAIQSATAGPSYLSPFVIRQGIALLFGWGLMLLFTRIDYRGIIYYVKHLYWGNLFLLTVVLLIGRSAKGAQRWIPLVGGINLQPSELAKLAIILTLASFVFKRISQIDRFSTLLHSAIYISLPMFLIFKQPDLGTSLVLVAIWLVTLFLAGARIKHLLVFILAGLLLFALAWHTSILKDYQKERLITFLEPERDPQGAGYHIRQSQIAVGSGRLLGKGLFQGTQKKLGFVPERHTDFIFATFAEEFGFIGGILLLSLYMVFLLRIADLILHCEDLLGRLITGGILTMFSFHTLVNIGMNIGVMPVTGVPLPFFSYGPSNLITSYAAVGLLESIRLRRQKITF